MRVVAGHQYSGAPKWLLGASLGLLLAATPVLAQSTWTVERGQTLYSIARALAPGNIKAQAAIRTRILALNPQAFENGDPGRMKSGTTLKLPKSTPTKSTLNRARAAAPPAKSIRRSEQDSSQPPAIKSTATRSTAQPATQTSGPRVTYSPTTRRLLGGDPAPSPRRSTPTVQTAQPASTAGAVKVARGSPPPGAVATIVVEQGALAAVDPTGQRRELSRQSAVFDGDTLVTGPQSRAQVRFTDGALVALRAETEFKVENYKFNAEGGGGEERAFFRLVKGGLRTITGLIGRKNKADYQVSTAVATIGIRGTHYGLLMCTGGSCDGLADGLYGGVVSGGVTAQTNAGLSAFGTDEFFQIQNPNVLPQLINLPPPTLLGSDEPPRRDGPRSGQGDGQNDGQSGQLARNEPGDGNPSGDDPNEGDGPPRLRGPGGDGPPPGGPRIGPGTGHAPGTPGHEPIFAQGEELLAMETLEGLEVVLAPEGSLAVLQFIELVDFDPVTGTPLFEASGGPIRAQMPSRIFLDGAGPTQNIVRALEFFDTGNGGANDPPGAGGPPGGGGGDDCAPCVFGAAGANLVNAGGAGGPGLGVNWGRWQGPYFLGQGGEEIPTVGDVHFAYSPNLTDPGVIATKTGTSNYTTQVGGTKVTNQFGAEGGVANLNVDVNFSTQEITKYNLDVTGAAGNWTAHLPQAVDGDPMTEMRIPIPQALMGDLPLEGKLCAGTCGGGMDMSAHGKASVNFIGNDAQRLMSGFGLQTDNGDYAITGTVVVDD